MSENLSFQHAEYEDALGSELDFRGVRMPAAWLDQMLAAAVAFTDGRAEPIEPLDNVQISLDGQASRLMLAASDGYTAITETVIVNHGYGSDFAAFLLHRDDVRTLRSLLKNSLKACEKGSRDVLPVDLMWDDTGRMDVCCEDRRATFCERDDQDERPFPNVAKLMEPALAAVDEGPADAFDVAINADFLSRLRIPQKVHGVFRFQRGQGTKGSKPTAIVATALNQLADYEHHERTIRVLILPIHTSKTDA